MNAEPLLKNISRHIKLDKAETEFLLSLLQVKKLKRKEFLLRQGEVCATENFVIKGCLRVYTINEEGVEHVLLFGIEGWWVADLYSLLAQKPAGYFIDALEDTEILQIAKDNLDLLYERVPKFERFFRIVFQNALIAHQQRIHENLTLPAEQRYLNFIKRYPAFEQRIPQKQVATYLGITPVFLSMLRKKLSKG